MNGERDSPTRLGETRATYSAENPEHLAALKAELGASVPPILTLCVQTRGVGMGVCPAR